LKEIDIFNKKIIIIDKDKKNNINKGGRPSKRTDKTISEVFKLKNQGLSLREIGKTLKISYSTVNRILKNGKGS